MYPERGTGGLIMGADTHKLLLPTYWLEADTVPDTGKTAGGCLGEAQCSASSPPFSSPIVVSHTYTLTRYGLLDRVGKLLPDTIAMVAAKCLLSLPQLENRSGNGHSVPDNSR